jgi:uncharacterized protein (DUF1330 family)
MIENALHPTHEQIDSFLKAAGNDPEFLLNLLKFKPRAAYHDGEDISGEAAYGRYAKAFSDYVRPHGVETRYGGKMLATLIGTGEPIWDAVAIVTYPSARLMLELTSSDAYRALHKHRRAGLDGQLLIACDDMAIF